MSPVISFLSNLCCVLNSLSLISGQYLASLNILSLRNSLCLQFLNARTKNCMKNRVQRYHTFLWLIAWIGPNIIQLIRTMLCNFASFVLWAGHSYSLTLSPVSCVCWWDSNRYDTAEKFGTNLRSCTCILLHLGHHTKVILRLDHWLQEEERRQLGKSRSWLSLYSSTLADLQAVY